MNYKLIMTMRGSSAIKVHFTRIWEQRGRSPWASRNKEMVPACSWHAWSPRLILCSDEVANTFSFYDSLILTHILGFCYGKSYGLKLYLKPTYPDFLLVHYWSIFLPSTCLVSLLTYMLYHVPFVSKSNSFIQMFLQVIKCCTLVLGITGGWI